MYWKVKNHSHLVVIKICSEFRIYKVMMINLISHIIKHIGIVNLWSPCLWNHCFKDVNQVCDHSGSVGLIVTLVNQDSNKTAIRRHQPIIGLSGVKLAITSNLFVIIQWLAEVNWQKSQTCYHLKAQKCTKNKTKLQISAFRIQLEPHGSETKTLPQMRT